MDHWIDVGEHWRSGMQVEGMRRLLTWVAHAGRCPQHEPTTIRLIARADPALVGAGWGSEGQEVSA